MPQVKIYGLNEHLAPIKQELSDIIHLCLNEGLKMNTEKRFHRFFTFDSSDFIYGPGRSIDYTVIEIIMYEGRSVQTIKSLIKLLYERIEQRVHITNSDLEIIIFEIPKHRWGISGATGDERETNYKVEI